MLSMSVHSQQFCTLNSPSYSTFLSLPGKVLKIQCSFSPSQSASASVWPKQTCRRWDWRRETHFSDTSKCFESHQEKEEGHHLVNSLWILNASAFIFQMSMEHPLCAPVYQVLCQGLRLWCRSKQTTSLLPWGQTENRQINKKKFRCWLFLDIFNRIIW